MGAHEETLLIKIAIEMLDSLALSTKTIMNYTRVEILGSEVLLANLQTNSKLNVLSWVQRLVYYLPLPK